MKRLWRLWFIFYGIVLFYVVFFAERRPKPVWGAHREIPLLIPLKMKLYLYRHGSDISSLYLDVVGNIIMFTPLPLFLYIAMGVKRYSIMIAISFSLSFFIELVQYAFGVGMPDIDDLIFNTLGAALGCIIISGVANAINQNSISPRI